MSMPEMPEITPGYSASDMPVAVKQSPPPPMDRHTRVGVPVSNIEEAMRVAELLSASSYVVASDRGKPANIFMKILWGAELGLGPIQSLSSISVVNNRPMLEGQLLLALVHKAGHKVSFPREDADGVTCRIQRCDNGDVFEGSFTMADARQANLAGKDNWKNYSKDMLQWRAVARAFRKACSEVALGFYAEGEIVPEDEPVNAEIVDQVTVVTQEDIQAQVAEIEASYVEDVTGIEHLWQQEEDESYEVTP